MSDSVYLAFDTETGGLGREVSLLSAHFAICDQGWNIIDELELFTKPNDGLYKVEAEALGINKINLVEHDKIAMHYSAAGTALRAFLYQYSDSGRRKLIPVGKNIYFDITKVNDNILGAKAWSQLVSYRVYDITGLILYLKNKGKLPKDLSTSLFAVAQHLGITFAPHTAKADNYAAVEVMKLLEAM